MKLPSKVTTYKESTISKFPFVLAQLSSCDMSPLELYYKTKKQFGSVTEFIDTLDCLYSMGTIEIDRKTGRLSYVG